MTPIAIVVVPLVVMAADIDGVTACATHKPPDAREWWSWREVDGRRCYYAGRPGRPKELLRWVVTRQPEPEPEAPPVVVDPVTIVKPVRDVGFNRAWRELMIELHVAPFWMERTPAREWR